MKIFIYTSNFLETKPLIELVEFTFKYGAQNGKPSILVRESDLAICKIPSPNEHFIFIFDKVSLDRVKQGMDFLFDQYGTRWRSYIFVIANIKKEGDTYLPEFHSSDLDKVYANSSFRVTRFFVWNTVGVERDLSSELRDIIHSRRL